MRSLWVLLECELFFGGIQNSRVAVFNVFFAYFCKLATFPGWGFWRREVHVRSEVYSIGITILQLITAEQGFDRASTIKDSKTSFS